MLFGMGSQVLQTSLAPGLAKSSAALPASVAGVRPATARDRQQYAGVTLALPDYQLRIAQYQSLASRDADRTVTGRAPIEREAAPT